MKAKEFLNKIMRGDKTTIKNNTGIIGFDEKMNIISGDTGGGSFIMIPGEITQIMMEFPDNPHFEKSGDDIAATFAFVGPQVTSMSFTIDELSATLPPDNGPITEETSVEVN